MTETAIIIGAGAQRALGAALARRFAAGGMHAVIAEAFWQIHTQTPSAWTHELDLRPFKEPF